MDAVGVIRLVKIYNKEVEKFILGRKWFEDDGKYKKELIIKYEKLRVMIRKSFPKAKTENMLADVLKKTFGINDNQEIIKLLNTDTKVEFTDDEDVEFFLSNNYRDIMF